MRSEVAETGPTAFGSQPQVLGDLEPSLLQVSQAIFFGQTLQDFWTVPLQILQGKELLCVILRESCVLIGFGRQGGRLMVLFISKSGSSRDVVLFTSGGIFQARFLTYQPVRRVERMIPGDGDRDIRT